ncbi:MAG TPA: hypothetical protein VHG32_24270 [Thermoanaerobaculia bacterium]|jgi:hypothetical protein|nr:hypothetical protein [Thermoanaerobaculia bacterium]
MSYTFRIVFGGLCALVPREKEHELDILLINTQNDRAGKLSHVPPLHVPRLEFDLADLTGGSSVPAGTLGYWRLKFEQLAISAKGSSQPLTFAGDLSTIQSGKTGAGIKPSRDFSWIPDLRSVCPLAGNVEADCFAAQPVMGANRGFIMGRLTLDRGVANVRDVSSYRGDEVMAEFLPKYAGSTAARAAMPHLAQVTMDVDDGEVVTITGKRFDGKKPRSLHLGPAKPGDEIEVHLTNLCCGGYLDVDDSKPPKEDDDFECFYILCQNFDELLRKLPRLPIPVPVEFATAPKKGSLVGGGGNPIACSMTRMQKG